MIMRQTDLRQKGAVSRKSRRLTNLTSKNSHRFASITFGLIESTVNKADWSENPCTDPQPSLALCGSERLTSGGCCVRVY
jgi:hypothetical protein